MSDQAPDKAALLPILVVSMSDQTPDKAALLPILAVSMSDQTPDKAVLVLKVDFILPEKVNTWRKMTRQKSLKEFILHLSM